jgi:hypothetical protein
MGRGRGEGMDKVLLVKVQSERTRSNMKREEK